MKFDVLNVFRPEKPSRCKVVRFHAPSFFLGAEIVALIWMAWELLPAGVYYVIKGL